MITRRSLLSTLALLPGLSFFSKDYEKQQEQGSQTRVFKPGDIVITSCHFNDDINEVIQSLDPGCSRRFSKMEVVRSDKDYTICTSPHLIDKNDRRYNEILAAIPRWAFTTSHLLTEDEVRNLPGIQMGPYTQLPYVYSIYYVLIRRINNHE